MDAEKVSNQVRLTYIDTAVSTATVKAIETAFWHGARIGRN